MRTSFTKTIGIIIMLFTIIYSTNISAQTEITQTIRGTVSDMKTDQALIGATLILSDDKSELKQTTTDADGCFKFEAVPVGRYVLNITYVGYQAAVKSKLLLNSGKELIVDIQLEESTIKMNEITVKATQNKDKTRNKFASISARSFTVEETERYAGSLGDPSRMAANYAGVSGTDDNRNDIIIRGNSPTGLLWRLDGIDIPNPNHFSTDGATGGPVSMINNNLLTNSDFFTGAFPAEYGNAMSGVFDLKLRNGNNQKYEFLGQIGFGGFELGAEGPFSKQSKASFIFNYRYSTLAVFDLIGLKFDSGTGGTIPQYQDLTFKINIPTKKLGRFELFGLGGISSIEMLDSKRDTSIASFSEGGIDLYNGSSTGIIGFKHTYYLPKNAKIITKISTTATLRGTDIDSLQKNNILVKRRMYASKTSELNHTAAFEYNRKINAKNFIQTGIKQSLIQFNYLDSVYRDSTNQYFHNYDEKGDFYQTQFYTSWQHKFSDNLILNSGLFAFYFPLNKQWSAEPRVNAKWKINPKQSFNVGLGMHSQTQIPLIYFYQNPDTKEYDHRNLSLNRAIHYVLGYDYLLNPNFRLKAETYFQQLYNIPVSEENPQYSMINTGDDYYVGTLSDMVNKGKGRNYGIELTVEKFLSKNYYFLLTTSLFDSKYLVEDDWLDTKFNGQYILNLLGGYEFVFSQKSSLLIDLKGVYAGGKRVTPIDETASIAQNETVYDYKRAYSIKLPPYFKLNVRISFRSNGKKTSQEWALDLQNVTNHKNVFSQTWDTKTKKIKTRYQQGFMPMMTYRILF